MPTGTEITIIVCMVASFVLVAAEWRAWPVSRGLLKVIASSAFVAVALQLEATATAYGRLILAALALSWVGDVFLLSKQSRNFMLGIASFLASHIVYSIAFAHRPLSEPALVAGFAVMGCTGIIVLKWLWSHLSGFYRFAVTAYIFAIIVMCSFAIAVCSASGNWILAVGALAFAASDISVARDRFVAHAIINRAWGLPLYYTAQVVLALSVGGAGITAI